jgi:hypothetical protein
MGYMSDMDDIRGYGDLTREIQRTLGEAARLRKADRNDPRLPELMFRVDLLARQRAAAPLAS